MSTKLYLFNPEHDLALANSDPNYVAPMLAQTLATDLSVLPIWFCKPESVVVIPERSIGWFKLQQQIFMPLKSIRAVANFSAAEVTLLAPWGWDQAIHKRFRTLGISEQILPSQTELDHIKLLSHRRKASELLAFLRNESGFAHLLPVVAPEIRTIDEVRHFVINHFPVVLKAPYSGSGKGICWVCKSLEKSQLGWCENTILKQGSVMAEKVYEKLQDFAMLFESHNGQIAFVGYSLFETENGIYRSNTLLSNDQIETVLVSLGVEIAILHGVQNLVASFLSTQVGSFYSGTLGVDMFIYSENGGVKLHPSVEINLRTTMGMVARRFFDQFVDEHCTGSMYLDFYKNSSDLFHDHQVRQKEYPLVVSSNRIVQGYFCASDIHIHSQYRLRIEIIKQS